MVEPMEFRDRLVGLLNLSFGQFCILFFDREANLYSDIQTDKWRHFQQDPLSVMLLLDQTNFTRVAKYLLEEEE